MDSETHVFIHEQHDATLLADLGLAGSRERLFKEHTPYSNLTADLPKQEGELFIGFELQPPFTPAKELHFIEVAGDQHTQGQPRVHQLGEVYTSAHREGPGFIRVFYHFPPSKPFNDWLTSVYSDTTTLPLESTYFVWDKTSNLITKHHLDGGILDSVDAKILEKGPVQPHCIHRSSFQHDGKTMCGVVSVQLHWFPDTPRRKRKP